MATAVNTLHGCRSAVVTIGRSAPISAVPVLAVCVVLLEAAFGVLSPDALFWVLTPLRLVVLLGLLALVAGGCELIDLRTRLDLPIGLLLIAGTVVTVRTGQGWPAWRTLVTTVAVHYLVVGLFRTRQAEPLPLAALVTVAAAGCSALAQVAHDVPTGFCRSASLADAPCHGDALVRATGTFANPNLLAAFLVLLVPFAVVAALHAVRGPERLVLGLLAASGCLGLLATFSRAGFVAGAAGLLVLAAALLRPRLPGLPGPATVAAGGAVLLVATAVIAARAGGSGGVRRDIWAAAIRTGLRHPGGVGLGRAGDVIAATTPGGQAVRHAHDLWLNWFAEAGVLGLAGIGAVTVAVLVNGILVARRGSPAGVAALAGALGYLLMSLLDHPANSSRIAVTAWLVFAVIAAQAPPTWSSGRMRRRGRHAAHAPGAPELVRTSAAHREPPDGGPQRSYRSAPAEQPVQAGVEQLEGLLGGVRADQQWPDHALGQEEERGRVATGIDPGRDVPAGLGGAQLRGRNLQQP